MSARPDQWIGARHVVVSLLVLLVAWLANGSVPAGATPSTDSHTTRHSAIAYSLAPGSVAPSAGTAANAYVCAWGTATTDTCPQVHWTNDGYARPQVYFADHAQSIWPVAAAAAVWDEASYIDVYDVGVNCPGYSGTHCVNVYDGNFGATGWVGYTSYSWDGNDNLVDGSVTIYLNDYYGLNAYGHRQSACHEMGHALGLGHDSSTGSCLYADILNSSAMEYPSADDMALLNYVYSTAH